jgi:cytochrome c oxidase accessory protein FixG
MAYSSAPSASAATPELDALYEGDATFRDSLGTVGPDGKRKWVYAKLPTAGQLYRARMWVYWGLIVVMVAMPLVEIHGHPFMLFDVIHRRFIVFGQIFWPQDLYLFAIALIMTIFGVGLFTLAFGRLFCGWACPQTVFMEGVFRRLDRLIEGSPEQQRKRDEGPWTWDKTSKKLLKHGSYLVLAFVIGNVFLMYLIGRDGLWQIITDDPRQHLGGLSAMLAFTGLTWFNFAKFREQTCLVVCPYGRLQGVLLDANSIVVAYDWRRGEPRGKLSKTMSPAERASAPDCIDCYECVRVCPTAIDIRNGTQLECVNCTACIDACDAVMSKVGKPKGLVRYASKNQIDSGKAFRFSGRMMWLSGVLVALGVVLTGLTFSRADVATTLLRLPGTSFQRQADGRISNTYSLKLINKTFDAKKLRIEVASPAGFTVEMSGGDKGVITVPGEGSQEGLLILSITPGQLAHFTTPVTLRVYEQERVIETLSTSFLGPFTGTKDLPQ